MIKKVSADLTVTGLVLACLSTTPLTLAATPYWDNSGQSSGQGQSFYTPQKPGKTTSKAAPKNTGSSYTQSNYGQQNNGQPDDGQSGNSDYNSGDSGYGQSNYGQNNYGQSNYGSGYSNSQPPLKGYVATAPVGTTLSVTNTEYLSSSSARIGDPITVTLGYDLSMGGNMILPQGTQIQGEVVSSVPAGRTGRHGELQLHFNHAALPDGRQVPLSARLITQDGTGIIRGGTNASRVGNAAKRTLGGAALGAAGGTALGAIVSGGRKWNEGMLWGSILGAGTGLLSTGVSRGEEAQLQPGSQLQLMLDQPLNVTSGSSASSYQQNPY